ncbi:MAG: DUF72 domain-containing protein [Nocardioides sp.]
MTVRVGISGWRYPPWRGEFYPPGLPQRDELRYVAERMNSVEINGSFYSLQRRSNFEAWKALVPEDFTFAVKGGRFITHMKKLADVEAPLANFFASGVLALGPKLGPVLWQLPPDLAYDERRIAAFLDLLPKTTGTAAQLAGQHDDKLSGDRVLTECAVDRPIRHALEARDSSFGHRAALALLEDRDVALVASDNPGAWPYLEERTAGFMYARLHGHTELYASGYSPSSLDSWAEKILDWREDGLDVYVYFDNDGRGRAPHDAVALPERLNR